MTETLPLVPDPSAPELPPGLVMPRFHEHITRSGMLLTRSLVLPMDKTAAWQRIWGKHKAEFTRRGFSLKCDNGRWSLAQWLVPDAGACRLTKFGADKVLALGKVNNRSLPLAFAPAPVLDLPPLPGDLESKLLNYQVQPARQLFRALTHGLEDHGYPGCWDCSGLGTGKTYQSLAAALATGKQVGVICPLAVIGSEPLPGGKGSGWLGAFAHFGAKPLMVRNYESLRTGNQKDFIVKTDNSKRPFRWIPNPENTVLIFDECHLTKNRSLNRSMAFAALRQGFPMIMVSGTLAANPVQMGATGVCVGLHRGNAQTFEMFLASHGCEKIGGTWKFKAGRQGAFHLAKIHRAVFPTRGARVRIEDLKDFPETRITCEAFQTPDTEAIIAAFKRAEVTIENLASQGKSENVLLMLKQAAYLKAWHESEKLKIPLLVDMTKAEIEDGRSVALFTNFIDVREALMKALKTDCAIHGQQSIKAKQECIRRFQADESRVIVCNTAAGGVGVSLHDVNGKYPRTAIILPTNNAVHINQALGRVHRAGGKSKSIQRVVFASGTVEESISDSVRAKIAQTAILNDGDMNPPQVF